MQRTQLTREQRAQALREMGSEKVDILVVGGGVTGAGIALDAATRGLRVAIVEAQDWAGGTSAWSSKLVHGGLRYLYQFNFALVAEALKERGLLLTRTAPHLVKAQPFLWPLKTPVVERSYSAVGVGMYDMLAQYGGGGRSAVPAQKHYSKEGARKLFPGIREDALIGAIRFYDARVDDARLVIDLVRTAQGYGALAASRAQVTGYLKDNVGGNQRVTGATVKDLESGLEFDVRADYVINATGVWTEQTQDLATQDGGLQVLASKGIHIVVPKDRIDGSAGIFLRTEKSVLFIIPWDRYWVIGTTDTEWTEDLTHPVCTAADIDYVLEHANSVLATPLTREDIIGTYAGLRPLLQPKVKGNGGSAKVSREHTVAEVMPGLSAIAGGKLTTYRVMAQDAIDFALTRLHGKQGPKERPCVTEQIPLVGASGYPAWQAQRDRIATDEGFTPERVQHLLDRYGDELPDILDIIAQNPDLGRPLEQADAYLGAEVSFAVTHEGALHLEDIVRKRIRLDYEQRDRGLAALPEIAEIAAPLLGWDEETVAREIDAYRERVEAEAKAEKEQTDAEAIAVRLSAPDITPMV
ncbi:glycerol-3-phosphate dehydrogenase/oxidase [Dermatophilus congolensis]|uniref:glycerol-3-phosphate dehydrogenase/oxidase n=1 Tax=Dermatophilus congolensis TaxID=1863 RepID=UPI001AAF242D|nr:glycerol-3-phosphate dehydrogenase/oxidase [Dermatophilus congolensis]MBO3128759.1 glycerol-3-phosphate dehydrogenase/oxidase [Dermatophilus congolensis]MBO3132605.1 glycerol-3-phosphate dehydrogenase/oxidase [Dermatophilus congolensis]MBO3133233.1 glycerol-3-phosphate dehydrogenase/oxidase [Dermatophilus congolensis]MBO3135469.1 glycerol-3-phosphate dehydrogenase/oxidase [Dermatophilus congolensis]MBO3137708.1 glycerol-3-phosphate dehydrogenase/oxidase [Dermatophilus congolensis]